MLQRNRAGGNESDINLNSQNVGDTAAAGSRVYKPGVVTKKWGLKRGESGTTSLGGIDAKIDEIEEEEYFGNQDSNDRDSRGGRKRETTLVKKRESS